MDAKKNNMESSNKFLVGVEWEADGGMMANKDSNQHLRKVRQFIFHSD